MAVWIALYQGTLFLAWELKLFGGYPRTCFPDHAAFPQRVISYRPGPESQTRVLIEKEREVALEPAPEPEPEEGKAEEKKAG